MPEFNVNKAHLELEDILLLHDKAYEANENTREKAAEDLLFSRLTQWDDSILNDVESEYRGEFNICRKERRRAIKEMHESPVQVRFKVREHLPNADQLEDLMNGIYRADMRTNHATSAINVAFQDMVDCGFGAWRITTEYENNKNTASNDQIIKRELIHEANNVVFFDPSAKQRDKSDANHCTVIHAFSKEGYEFFKQQYDLKGEDSSFGNPNFPAPYESFTYPWRSSDESIRVGEFYYKHNYKSKYLIFQNEQGEVIPVKRNKLKEFAEQLAFGGFQKVAEKTIMDCTITKYIVTNSEILKKQPIAGKYIPIIPIFGEWSYLEGEEIYEGITRLAKDPQRLHNFMMSYLADIVVKGNRKKPFFNPEQIRGWEQMYQLTGQENNLPYYLLNRVDHNGLELPQQPLGYMEQPEMPPALGPLLQLTTKAIEDATQPSPTAKSMETHNVSGKAAQLNYRRMESQLIDFQGGLQFGLRHDGMVFASMASEIYDTPRKLQHLDEMYNESVQGIMQDQLDPQTGMMVTVNDIRNLEFDVYTELGQKYASVRQETREDLKEMYNATAPVNPQLANIILMQYLSMLDGAELRSLKEYASKQLLLMGIRKPTNQQEMAMVQQAQQQAQEPSPLEKAEIQQMMSAAAKDSEHAKLAQVEMMHKAKESEKLQAQTQQIMMETMLMPEEMAIKRMEAHLKKLSPSMQKAS